VNGKKGNLIKIAVIQATKSKHVNVSGNIRSNLISSGLTGHMTCKMAAPIAKSLGQL